MLATRSDGRSDDALRPIECALGFQRNPEGSVLYRCGGTRVLVAASIDESVPSWLKGQGRGWLTAEYAMHPRANPDRQTRDGRRGRIDGRTAEIQRLIGRSLRACLRLDHLPERMICIDCDVLDADGGTRTASITAGFIALTIALDKLRGRGELKVGALRGPVAAISVGMVGDRHLLDLPYEEDSKAEVDLNVVASDNDAIVEVQGTAEGAPIAKSDFDRLLALGLSAMPELFELQRRTLGEAGIDLSRLTG